jgi:hypothetical protein
MKDSRGKSRIYLALKMDQLLIDILNAPTGPSIDLLEQRLNDRPGEQEFLALLTQGNRLAFNYLKMKIKEYIGEPGRSRFIHENKEFFYSLLFQASEPNFACLCSVLEVLYLNNVAWDDLVEFLVSRGQDRAFKVLSTIFSKYRILQRSDALYTEIIQNIGLCREVFKNAYFDAESRNVDILGMFYLLVYQDIHPFFEENADKFFSAFCHLFKHQELQQELCEIFNLFIIKYPECLDMTRVLGALLLSITEFEYGKYTVLLNIAKRKNFSVLSKFSFALSNAIKIGAALSEHESSEMRSDKLHYTREILRNNDVGRGILAETIEHLSRVLGEDWSRTLVELEVQSPADEERFVYLCIASKIRMDAVAERCSTIASDSRSNPCLGFIAYRYLTANGMYEKASVDLGYIDKDNPSCYMALHYISERVGLRLRGKGIEAYSLPDGSRFKVQGCSEDELRYNAELLNRTLRFLKGESEDEYSALLIQRLIRTDSRLITPEFVSLLQAYVESNIRNINSPAAFSCLLDVLGLVFLHSGDPSFLLSLIQIAISEEIVEIYASILFMLAAVVLRSAGSFSSVTEIIAQERLWRTKELVLPMSCLTIALFKSGYCREEQVEYIVTYLLSTNAHSAYVILNAVPTHKAVELGLKNGTDVEEVFILASTLCARGVVGLDDYKRILVQAMGYFMDSYVSRRNARRFRRALDFGTKHIEDSGGIEPSRIPGPDYENVPFTAMLLFEL